MSSLAIQVLEQAGATNSVAGVIDVSAWGGAYPFRNIPRSSVQDLVELRSTLSIARSVISPYEAVFWENGLDAYARYSAEWSNDARLDVWPVVRPGALHGLEALLDRYQPRGLRLIPSYHAYHLYDAGVEAIMRLARERGMIVQIFTRLADERWHWMLKVPELPLHDIEYAIAIYDQQPLIVSGLNQPQSLAGRMRQHSMLYADISRHRGPTSGIERLVRSAPVDRLLFGSLWPVQVIEATLFQVTTARIEPVERDAILRENARALLRLNERTP